MTKKALFTISSLWLWHATRSLPIIKFYLEKWYKIDIVCFWDALNYLKSELKNFDIIFFELKDYPALERWSWFSFYFMLVFDLITTYYRIKKEQIFLKKIQAKTNYDFIFSDGKYWFYSKKTKSYILSHQVSFEIPKVFWFSQKFMDFFNKKYFSKFDMLFIPDYENKDNNLAWKLSHANWISNINHKYIWILSSFSNISAQERKKERKKESEQIDYLFTISGYLKQYKKWFIEKLMEEAKALNWKKVFILWETNKKEYSFDEKNNIEIFSFLAWEEKNKKFQNAKVIISRAGYTTIMDLVELNKKAILFPTPNQTEQLYLAKYLWEKKYFVKWENVENNFHHKKDGFIRWWWKNLKIWHNVLKHWNWIIWVYKMNIELEKLLK